MRVRPAEVALSWKARRAQSDRDLSTGEPGASRAVWRLQPGPPTRGIAQIEQTAREKSRFLPSPPGSSQGALGRWYSWHMGDAIGSAQHACPPLCDRKLN